MIRLLPKFKLSPANGGESPILSGTKLFVVALLTRGKPPGMRSLTDSMRCGSVVQRLAKDLAGLESQHPSGRDGNLLAGLRISSPTGFLFLDNKIPESGNLDLLTIRQAVLDDIKDRLDDPRRILLRKT